MDSIHFPIYLSSLYIGHITEIINKKIDFPFIPCSYTPLLSRPSTPPNEFYLPFPSLFSSPLFFTSIQSFNSLSSSTSSISNYPVISLVESRFAKAACFTPNFLLKINLPAFTTSRSPPRPIPSIPQSPPKAP